VKIKGSLALEDTRKEKLHLQTQKDDLGQLWGKKQSGGG